jgi:hypothetical protein
MALPQIQLHDLTDPEHYTLEQAEQIAAQLMREGQRIPERFALALQAEPPPDGPKADRMLELLPRIAPPARLLPLLDRIIPTLSARIRSKAWKLYAGALDNPEWAISQIEDEDERIAANIVEALWRAKPCDTIRDLFWRAARQPRSRVAGNGLVGLFNYGDPRAPQLLKDMAAHESPVFRATAAWVIARVYWRDGVDLLRIMRCDRHEKVREAAERSLLRLLRRFPYAA